VLTARDHLARWDVARAVVPLLDAPPEGAAAGRTA